MSRAGYLAQLSRTALLYILAVLATSVALMYKNMPVWISIVAVVCVIWRLFIFSGKLSFPPLWLKILLVFFRWQQHLLNIVTAYRLMYLYQY